MNNKKIGTIILSFSLFLLLAFLILISTLNQEAHNMGCFEDPGCAQIETSLSIIHFAFGSFGFLFALGFYLLFFSRSENAILDRLESDTQSKVIADKFSILKMGLDEFEKRVIEALMEQPKITQNTLCLRTDMSKAKLSQVLSALEQKNLVRREDYKKTRLVHLIIKF